MVFAKRPDFPFFKCPTIVPLLVFKQTAYLSTVFTGSHWTSKCSPNSGVHMLYIRDVFSFEFDGKFQL